MDSQPRDHRSFFPSTSLRQLASDGNQLQRHQHHHHQEQHSQQAQQRIMFPYGSSSSSQQSSQPALGSMGLPTAEQQQYPSQSQDSSQPHSPITLDMLGDWLQISMQGMDPTTNLSHHQDSSTHTPSSAAASQAAAAGEANMAVYNPQLLLDHQFRLTQLQQLQQLQQQIFQQQIAIISGQPPSLLNNNNNNASSTFELQRDHHTFTFNGLPTPASSGELRPQQQSLDFIAPMALNTFIEGTSQPHRDLNTHHSLPNSPTLHSAPESVMSSPVFLGTNSGQLQNSQPFSSTPYIPPGSVSAPEYIAFQTSPSHNGPSPPADLDLDISPLTSPWLGAQPISQQQVAAASYQNQVRNRSQSRQHTRLPSTTARSSPPPSSSQTGPSYPTTPLTGPINTSINSNNKRSASPTSGTTDARKKHSPAVRPTHPNATFSQHPDQPTRRSHRAGSRSTSSTPHIHGRPAPSRQRKGSVVTPTITEAPGDSPSPVDLSMPPPAAPPLPSNTGLISPSTARFPTSPAMTPLQQQGNGTPPHLTPVTPASIMNLDVKGKRLKIVTDNHPAGGASNSGSAGPSASTSPVSTRSKRGGINGGTSLISPSLKPILPGPSTVSPLLPMTPISYSNASHQHPSSSSAPASSTGVPPSSSSSTSSSSSSMTMLPPQVRKTSHKAAEQKRRDSLKTTFDELRGLLPPIPLPSSSATGSGGAHGSIVGGDEDGVSNNNNNVPGGGPSNSSGGVAGTNTPANTNTNTNTNIGTTTTTGIIFGNAAKPLLPGALPPRGPPKAGGEGPNKGVSKLQLLICGNDFIRTLKARVDRRDEEIARLRGEVRKLRHLLGVISTGVAVESPISSLGAGDGAAGGAELNTMLGVENLMAQLDLDLDLDRDLDAVEKMVGHSVGNGTSTSSGGRRDDIMSSARSDITMDEDVDDDEE